MKRLDKQQTELEMCEKALADYMESKRRAFPRFYFVSSADLLDILSNGNNPVKVMQHMSKCFQVSWANAGQSSSRLFDEQAACLALGAVAHAAWAQCSGSSHCLAGSLAWPGSCGKGSTSTVQQHLLGSGSQLAWRLQQNQHILLLQCDVQLKGQQRWRSSVHRGHVLCRLSRSSSWTRRRRLPGSGPRVWAWSPVLALSMSASRSHCPWRTRWAHSRLRL